MISVGRNVLQNNITKVMRYHNVLRWGSNGVIKHITNYILVILLQLLSPVTHYNPSCRTDGDFKKTTKAQQPWIKKNKKTIWFGDGKMATTTTDN